MTARITRLIEKEMREMGYRDFHRRSLYRRFERGTCKSGWIETYGWDGLLKQMRIAERGMRNEKIQNADVCILDDRVQNKQSSAIPHSAFRTPHLNDWDEFKNWLKQTWPRMTWEWKHQVYIYKHLKRVWDGECKRLMIFLPPRHGKSELVTVRFPAWCLKHKPETKVIIGSYNQRIANRFSRMARSALAEDAALQSSEIENGELRIENGMSDKNTIRDRSNVLRPPKCRLPKENSASSNSQFSIFNSQLAAPHRSNSAAEWETSAGGGVRAVGVGAGVTGYGAHLIVVDDPVKSRAEAESETFRERVWNWFNDDLYTRLEPDGKIILIQTRWHEDDLAGRLLKEAQEEGGEQWEVINLPALAERGRPVERGRPRPLDAASASIETLTSIQPVEFKAAEDSSLADEGVLAPSDEGVHVADDPLGRASGQALCPERFDEEKLDRIRRKLGSYSFAALYQQRPSPAEGGLFKRAWFRTVNTAPPNLRWKRGYDLGISTSATADYTASLRVAYDHDGTMYIDGGFRRRIEYPEQRRFILGRIAAEPDTEHGIELSANGNAVVQDLRREPRTRGRPLRGVKVKGDKVTRALPWIALAEEGRVFLVRGHWNTEFIDEAAAFPSGTHDDQIDAVSIAVRMHREHSGRLHFF